MICLGQWLPFALPGTRGSGDSFRVGLAAMGVQSPGEHGRALPGSPAPQPLGVTRWEDGCPAQGRRVGAAQEGFPEAGRQTSGRGAEWK